MRSFKLMLICLASLASTVMLGCPAVSEDDSTEPGSDQTVQVEDAICIPETTAFGWAMCLCDDLNLKGNGLTAEPLYPDAPPLNLGVNGRVSSMGNLVVHGTMDIGGELLDFGNTRIHDDLLVGERALIAGRVVVDEDAYFGESLVGAGMLKVGGGLSVADRNLFAGHLDYNQKPMSIYQPHDPCPCSKNDIINIKEIVRQHRLDTPLVLASGAGNQVVKVAAGDYYTDNAWVFAGNTRIEIDGKVRFFVEDDILLIGNGKITLLPGAQLDLYISGSLSEIGNFHFGQAYDENNPEPARVYVGGEKPITIIGNESFVGGIYAPLSTVRAIGNLKIVGSLFAKDFRVKGNAKISWNSDLVDDACVDDDSDEEDDGEGTDAGTDDESEESDSDDGAGDDVCGSDGVPN
ncbi:MAG: hypothetical protein MUC50_13900 [Myxococcota bacterium]|nr:hypothetical protein [Myxococcota bacterium]